MYSTIYQLATSPICPELYLSIHCYDDDFFSACVDGADYFEDDEDREGSIRWLLGLLAANNDRLERFTDECGREGFILRDGFHRMYLADKFAKFQRQLESLASTATLEAFCKGYLLTAVERLKYAFGDPYGIYVLIDGAGAMTLDDFVRCANIDTPYYFGGTVKYHC